MYGFSQIKSDGFIVGAELTQVCVGANEIILNFFPDGTSITVFDTQGFLENNSFMFEPLVDGLQKRIRQIGKTVKKFEVVSNDTAILWMSDGAEIVLKDDSSEFEAVTFQSSGSITVV
jgi:hypothetical protein